MFTYIMIYSFVCGLAHLAVCGDTFDLTFDLPFVDYLPKTVPIKFFIRVSEPNLVRSNLETVVIMH